MDLPKLTSGKTQWARLNGRKSTWVSCFVFWISTPLSEFELLSFASDDLFVVFEFENNVWTFSGMVVLCLQFVIISLAGWGLLVYGGYKLFTGGKGKKEEVLSCLFVTLRNSLLGAMPHKHELWEIVKFIGHYSYC